MRELYAIARNIRFFYVEDHGLAPEIEAVLTLAELKRDFIGGVSQSIKRLDTVRITMSPAGARKFAKDLNDWADEAERVRAEFVVGEEPSENLQKDDDSE